MALKRETREQWGAKPPRARRYVDKRLAQGVAVHYPGAPTDYRKESHESHRRTMRAWQTMHMNRNSNDLEYGSVICPCGIWMEARTEWDRPMTRVGSNGTAAANSTHTSVQLMIGATVPITQQEKEWLAEAIAWLRSQGWGNDVSPHSRFYATACPGNSVRNALPEIRRMADGGFTPTPDRPEPVPAGNSVKEYGMFLAKGQHDAWYLIGPTSAIQVHDSKQLQRLKGHGIPVSDERFMDTDVRWITDSPTQRGGVRMPGVDEKPQEVGEGYRKEPEAPKA